MATATLLLSVVALPVRAQSVPTTIHGVVIADDTGEPIANARVTASSQTLGAPIVLTDEEGRFALTVVPGTSHIVASKTGYERRDVAVPGASQGLDIRLRPGAALSGRVIDELGDPVQNARMSAQGAAAAPNEAAAATTQTDDRGEYRLASLPAGRYIVSAMTDGPTIPVVIGPNQVTYRQTFQSTYYPGTMTRGEAQPIALQPADDRPRIDFVVPREQPIRPFNILGLFARPPVPSPGAAATGIIRGRVAGSDGRSLPHAHVLLSVQNDPRQSILASADDDGHFEFRELPAESYRLVARKTGYGPVASNDPSRGSAATFLLSGVAVALADGETRERVDITLLRWGILTGRVLDERGDPLQGARVQLLKLRYEAGRRRLVPAGSTDLTDDLGRYRLAGLPPGSYIVSASVGELQSVELPGYARSYYPGTSETSQAQFVAVALAQDVTGIDFSLSRTRTARISGQLINAAGERTIGGSLTLMASQRSTSVTNVPMGARIQRDGQFEFSNVPPGQYLIQSYRSRSNAWTEGEFGALPVSVDGTDVANLVLQTTIGSSIRGRITFDARDPSSRPPRAAIEISPTPVDFDLAPPNVASADIHDDWGFDIAGVSGPRRLQLLRAPAGWALEEIRVNGISAIDRPLPFGRSDQSLNDVEIVLTDRVSELTGTVRNEQGRTASGCIVLLFPTARERWYPGSRFFRAAAAPAGTYTVTGLPFGSYYAAAIANLPNEGDDAWQDPAFLDALLPRASTITIRDGQKQSLDLHLGDR